MRIDLANDMKGGRQLGQAQRRRSGRRSRTLHSSVALPQALPRVRDKRGRGTSARDAWPQKPAERSQARPSRGRQGQVARSRPARRRTRAPLGRPLIQPEVAEQVRARGAIQWRAVALRLPVVLVLAALIGICVYGSTDAGFFVYQAQILGGRHTAADVIYQTAGVHEQNIFWIDPHRVAERIVQLPGIKAVRVRCELPAQVTIEVEEREPVVMWRATSQEHDFWLDEEGVVLPYHGDVNSPETVFVIDYGESRLQEGDRIEPAGIVQSVLQLDAAVPGVRVFFYQPGRGLSFAQQAEATEWTVYVGTSEDLARKIQVMQTLTGYLLANHIQPRYVDVRWADHPVYGRPAAEINSGGQ